VRVFLKKRSLARCGDRFFLPLGKNVEKNEKNVKIFDNLDKPNKYMYNIIICPYVPARARGVAGPCEGGKT
jgi:hypothetical protein